MLTLFRWIFIFILSIVLYFVFSWLFVPIARKKAGEEVGAGQFFIPFYRYYKLIRIYELPASVFLGLCLFTFFSIVLVPYKLYASIKSMYSMFGYGRAPLFSASAMDILAFVAFCISVTCLAYMWGKIAEALGDKFHPWAVAGFFAHFTFVASFLVPLILAYGNLPAGRALAGEAGDKGADGVKKMRLACVTGSAKGQQILAESGGSAVIGRAPGADIVIDSPEISRKHIAVKFTENGAELTDLSKNGIFLVAHGEKRRVDGSVSISRGALFEIGSPAVRLQLL